MSEQKDTKILEAILFASGEPVLEDDLKQKISFKNNLIQYLENIQDSYKNSGINLVKTGNKWSFRTSEDIKNNLTTIIFCFLNNISVPFLKKFIFLGL